MFEIIRRSKMPRLLCAAARNASSESSGDTKCQRWYRQALDDNTTLIIKVVSNVAPTQHTVLQVDGEVCLQRTRM